MLVRKISGVVLTFAVLISTCFAEAKFDKAEYMKSGGDKKVEQIKGDLVFDSAKKQIEFAASKAGETPALVIPYDSVKSLLYERTSKPRYAAGLLLAWPLLFTKSKKHYLTIQYTDASGTGQYAIIHLDKSNAQEAVASAEAETGKKVDRSEEH